MASSCRARIWSARVIRSVTSDVPLPLGRLSLWLTLDTVAGIGPVTAARLLTHFGGDIVTSPRSQAYYLATEYGVVNLAGRSTWERAEALVSIAHPDFREQLIAAAESQKIWRRSAKR